LNPSSVAIGGERVPIEPVVFHVLEALEGGTARHVVDIVSHADGVRHVVAVPSRRVGGVTDTSAAAAMVAAGATVDIVEMRRQPAHPRNMLALARLRGWVRLARPDVVHAHSSVGGGLGRLAALGTGTPVVYTPNGVSPSPFAVAVERSLGRFTARLVAVSASEAALVLRERIIAEDRIAVIPNGIDLEPPPGRTVDLRAAAGVPPTAPLVGCVARLLPQKAPEHFVRLAAEVLRARPDVYFLLVGSGPQRGLVEREVAMAALGPRWRHLPSVPRVGRALGQLDVFVLPSRFEGAPYAPLDAMRAGTPVVLSDAVGNRDVVEPGVSGIVVPVGDVEAMAEAVLCLLNDPTRREEIITAAKARLAACFDVRDMGAALARLYGEVAGRG
jgi:glycosyltransferase involved in cell wall biosynthesis